MADADAPNAISGRGLRGAGWALIATGLALAIVDTRAMPWFAVAIAEAFWGEPEMPAAVVPYHRFMHGVLGGVIAGWGAMVVVVAREAPRLAWRGLAVGVGVWFVVDTAASVFHGAWPNALLNTVALVGAAALLALTRP